MEQTMTPILAPVSGVMLTVDESHDEPLLKELMQRGVTMTRVMSQEQIRTVRSVESQIRADHPFPHTRHVTIALDLESGFKPMAHHSAEELPDLILSKSLADARRLRQELLHPALFILKVQDQDSGHVSDDAVDQMDGVCVTANGNKKWSEETERLVRLFHGKGKAVIWTIDSLQEQDLSHRFADCLLLTDSIPQLLPEETDKDTAAATDGSETGTKDAALDVNNLPDDFLLQGAVNVFLNKPEAKVLVVITKSGESVRSLVRKFHSPGPIVAVVDNQRLARQLQVMQQVIPFFRDGDLTIKDWKVKNEAPVIAVSHFLTQAGLVTVGTDEMVVYVEEQVRGPAGGGAITCTFPVA